ncbi:MAG: metallophosphoesterase family protein [Candidatus Anstonellales archaeon]
MASIKFFAIADLHDRENVLMNIKSFDFSGFDAIIMAGDISSYYIFADQVINVVKSIGLPCFYVPGNNESFEIERKYRDAGLSIHNKVVNFKSYKIAGFGFSPITPFETPGELEEDEIMRQMKNLDIDNNTILITHCPPKGILDKGYGSISISSIIKEKKPLLNVFGHIHEVVGIEKHENTYFINLPPAKEGKAGVIRVNKNDVEVDFIEI